MAKSYDNPDTIVVARDGTGEFRTVSEALEVCRAFMDYHKVIYIKKGTYKEKVIIPQWLQNIELCGEDRDETIITYDDHANVVFPPTGKGMTTFRTYTLKVEANDITLRNLTIENNAARLGQAVALHTEGDRLLFVNCRFLGNQDTVYTGMPRTRMLFHDCYIEGTTDFIFGPATAWFEHCTIHGKVNSYITAASTPKDVDYGYVFSNCTVTAADSVTSLYLGRPWRDYGYTLFMNCELPGVICPEGWHHWEQHREQTARYFEYNNRGEGANPANRVGWSRQLTKKEAQQITLDRVFQISSSWILKH
jgi:pectin methylesterase-like acyl-CoA thioesterase